LSRSTSLIFKSCVGKFPRSGNTYSRISKMLIWHF
jgi:hypothetical protein